MTSDLQSSKLYQTVSGLTNVEVNRLIKFLSNSYFSKSRNSIDLITCLRIEKEFNKNDIWNKLFPEKDYDSLSMRKIMSDCYIDVLNFFAMEELRMDTTKLDILTLNYLERKGITTGKNSVARKTKTKSQRKPARSANYFLEQYEIESALYRFDRVDETRLSKESDFKVRINTIQEFLEKFYHTEKVRYSNALLSWSRLLNININTETIINSIENIPASIVDQTTALQFQLSVFRTLVNSGNEEEYQNLKHLITNSINILPFNEAKDIYDAATNYCLHKINTGNTNYIKELLLLYQTGINKNILIQDGKISPWAYKNIVTIALRAKEFHYAQRFIDKYAQYLPDKYNKSIYALCSALLNFWTGNYSNTLSFLQSVNFEESTIKSNAELILLCTYYELDEYSLLEDNIVRIRKYLSRQKRIDSGRIKIMKNFIRYLKRLVNTNHVDKLRQLKSEIEGDTVASKTWLLEKVDELLGENKESF